MALHRIDAITVGVPNVTETLGYYTDFGLSPAQDGWLSTVDGGRQMRIVPAPTRRLLQIDVAADDPDDIGRIAGNLRALEIDFTRSGTELRSTEAATGILVRVLVAPRLRQLPQPAPKYNGPGRTDRGTSRAPGVLRTGRVKPRKLGHAVVGTTDLAATKIFFTQGLGFKISDYIGSAGVFMRCSSDHHNILALASPVNYLHHTSWQVDDIDEIGRGASAMLENHPERHVWGLGRHHAGSNFFWYLKDPAGNFSEYYADMDCIIDDQLWTPEALEGAKGLFNWGPPPPPSFLAPDDLAAMMTGNHSVR
jgi:catechol 2,3-dioxygenase-like lactoylglutathione lyase family enzyme